MKKINYSEPSDYIPEEIRKELGLGEYNKDTDEEETKPEPEEKK